MNQTTSLKHPAPALRQSPGQAKKEAFQPRRDPTAALAAIIIGTATTTTSVRAAGLTDAYLTAHPLLTAAFAASVTAAMALAFTRHRALAALLLLTTAAALDHPRSLPPLGLQPESLFPLPGCPALHNSPPPITLH